MYKYIGAWWKVARRIFWKRVIKGEQLQEGYKIPSGWGVSYIVWEADYYIIHPLPLNYLVAATRWLMHKVQLPWFTNQEKKRMHKEYFRGWSEGWKDCMEKNVKDRVREMEGKDVLR